MHWFLVLVLVSSTMFLLVQLTMTKRLIDYSLLVEYLASWGFEIYEEMILSSQITIELLEYILITDIQGLDYFCFILCTFSWQLSNCVH